MRGLNRGTGDELAYDPPNGMRQAECLATPRAGGFGSCCGLGERSTHEVGKAANDGKQSEHSEDDHDTRCDITRCAEIQRVLADPSGYDHHCNAAGTCQERQEPTQCAIAACPATARPRRSNAELEDQRLDDRISSCLENRIEDSECDG